MLTIENVTKRFGEIVALDRVSLSLARGEFFGLLGPNGAGKTTLMSLVAGLRAPDSGSISIDGQRVGPNAMGPRHELGFVPQAIALYEELSAEENLRLFGKLYGLAGRSCALVSITGCTRRSYSNDGRTKCRPIPAE